MKVSYIGIRKRGKTNSGKNSPCVDFLASPHGLFDYCVIFRVPRDKTDVTTRLTRDGRGTADTRWMARTTRLTAGTHRSDGVRPAFWMGVARVARRI